MNSTDGLWCERTYLLPANQALVNAHSLALVITCYVEDVLK